MKLPFCIFYSERKIRHIDKSLNGILIRNDKISIPVGNVFRKRKIIYISKLFDYLEISAKTMYCKFDEIRASLNKVKAKKYHRNIPFFVSPFMSKLYHANGCLSCK